MRLRFKVLYINLVNTFHRDTAFFAENWSNVLSTLLYTATSVAVVQAIFTNIDSIGGFDRNDVYFLMLVGQVAFYLQSRITYFPALEFSEEINRGQLDFYLTKPVPHKFFIYTKSISFLIMLRDAIPPLIPVLWLIDWSALQLTPMNLLVGSIIFILGIVIDHCLIFLLSLSSIWSGSATYTLNFFWGERTETKLPYESLYSWFQLLVFAMLPAFIVATLSASVMLGESPAGIRLFQVLIATIGWLMLHNYVWRKAVRAYSSASS